MRSVLLAGLVLLAGCTSPPDPVPSGPSPPRASEASADALPDGATYSGTWRMATLVFGLDSGRSHPFTLKTQANVTIVVDVQGPTARDVAATIGVADDQGNAAGPVVASTEGPAQTHRALTASLSPGAYYAYGGLRDGAQADFAMTVSFAP